MVNNRSIDEWYSQASTCIVGQSAVSTWHLPRVVPIGNRSSLLKYVLPRTYESTLKTNEVQFVQATSARIVCNLLWHAKHSLRFVLHAMQFSMTNPFVFSERRILDKRPILRSALRKIPKHTQVFASSNEDTIRLRYHIILLLSCKGKIISCG